MSRVDGKASVERVFAFGPMALFESSFPADLRVNDYDPIADVFDESMALDFHDATHALREGVADRVHRDGGLYCLDLCCGSGLFLSRLSAKYRVRGMGIDLSRNQVGLAIKRCAGSLATIEHVVGDVRETPYPKGIDLATINFDALNHLGSEEEWHHVFCRVHEALRPGGAFLFDVNLPERLRSDWNSPEVIVKDHVVYLHVARAVEMDGKGVRRRTPMIFFVRNGEGTFQRRHAVIDQFALPIEEIVHGLRSSGFADVRTLHVQGAAPKGHIFNKNRAFLVANK